MILKGMARHAWFTLPEGAGITVEKRQVGMGLIPPARSFYEIFQICLHRHCPLGRTRDNIQFEINPGVKVFPDAHVIITTHKLKERSGR